MSATEWAEAAVSGFLRDAPDNQFQCGYLAACLAAYSECGGDTSAVWFKAAESLLSSVYQRFLPEALAGGDQ